MLQNNYRTNKDRTQLYSPISQLPVSGSSNVRLESDSSGIERPNCTISVCLVISSLGCGGAERVASYLINHLAQRSYHTSLVTLDSDAAPPFYSIESNVRIVRLNLYSKSQNKVVGLFANCRRIVRLRRALGSLKPSVIISFIEKTNVLALIAMLGRNVPLIACERTDPAHYKIAYPWSELRNMFYRRAFKVIVQTTSALEFFPRAIRERAEVVPNPVFPARVSHDHLLRVPESIHFVSLGRLSHEKGYDLLLTAFRTLVVRQPKCMLTIWGEGPCRRALEELRENYGLTQHVRFPGQTPDSFSALRTADIFVSSSRFEGFPNALCEAMACGVAVIAVDCPSGPRHIVRHGIDGILVPPNEVAALAAALESLAVDPGLRQRLGQRGTEITRRFNAERIFSTWENLIYKAAAAI